MLVGIIGHIFSRNVPTIIQDKFYSNWHSDVVLSEEKIFGERKKPWIPSDSKSLHDPFGQVG
jgi:hypothetical protein